MSPANARTTAPRSPSSAAGGSMLGSAGAVSGACPTDGGKEVRRCSLQALRRTSSSTTIAAQVSTAATRGPPRSWAGSPMDGRTDVERRRVGRVSARGRAHATAATRSGVTRAAPSAAIEGRPADRVAGARSRQPAACVPAGVRRPRLRPMADLRLLRAVDTPPGGDH